MRAFVRGLVYDDDGKLSRSAVLGVAGFFIPLAAALVCTGYVVIKGVKFDGYNEFLAFCSSVMLYSAGLLLGRAGINAVAYKQCEEKKDAINNG